MVAEIGRFALVLALMIALAQSSLPLIGAHRNDRRYMAFGDVSAIAQFAFIGLAFLCLTTAFVQSDFSLAVVAENSHTAEPLLYKVAGVWGNHEGSMLLWVLILAAFGATIAVFGRVIPETLRARTLSVQAMIGVGFLAFIIFTSNPFARIYPAPLQGAVLNPLLQDPGLASHPPFLYLGYVGFSTAFSFAIAALIEGRADSIWARFARPWILAAWSFLTIGITLGSLWAYYELGWGGFWFWDPVENASLMPWLLGTALVHSALVVERRHTLVKWTVLLGILTFSMSLIGTFVVRSGVLTSVHAFAVDPERGVFILALLVIATGGGLWLYAWRAPKLGEGSGFEVFSREGTLVLNNMLIVTLTATVFLGTFYPLFIDLIGKDKISVGPPFYALTFVPLAIPVFIAMVFGPLARWRKDEKAQWPVRVGPALVGAGIVAVVTIVASGGKDPVAALLVGLAVWLIIGALLVVARRIRVGAAPWQTSLQLAATLPRGIYGVAAAHLGIGLLVLGVLGATLWKEEKVSAMGVGDSVVFAGRTVRLLSLEQGEGPNYQLQRAVFTVAQGGHMSTLSPERRFYPEREMETTEATIESSLVGNFYLATGAEVNDTQLSVRMYSHPLAIWIWIGGAMMALGGLLACWGSRTQVTAAAPVIANKGASSPATAG